MSLELALPGRNVWSRRSPGLGVKRTQQQRAATAESDRKQSSKVTRSPRRPGRGSTGDGQPERLGGFKVDHELILARRLHRQIGRLSPLRMRLTYAAAWRNWSTRSGL